MRRFLRSTGAEVLDQAEASAQGQQIQRELDRWNQMSGWYRQHLKRIRQHWEALGKPAPFRVVDVGCGPGGLLSELQDWGRRYGIPLELTGLDQGATWLEMAREKLGKDSKVILIQGDATASGFADQTFDLATTTLMMHHLSPERRQAMVRELGRISRSQYIFDLELSLTGVVGWAGVSLALRFSPETRHDGIQSVRRGSTFEEFSILVKDLPVTVARSFPAGLCTLPRQK